MEVRELRRAFHRGGVDVFAEEADVVGDRSGEESRLLGHEREAAVPVVERELVHVVAIAAHRTLGGIAEPEQQLHERRLSRARRADDADDLAVRHVERDVLENRAALFVLEPDVVERDVTDVVDPSAVARERSRGVALLLFLQRLEQRRDLVQALDGALHALRVAERSEHDQHHRAERRDAREAGAVRDRERADEEEHRDSLVEHGDCAAPVRRLQRALRVLVGEVGEHVTHRAFHLEDPNFLERGGEFGDCRREDRGWRGPSWPTGGAPRAAAGGAPDR